MRGSSQRVRHRGQVRPYPICSHPILSTCRSLVRSTVSPLSRADLKTDRHLAAKPFSLVGNLTQQVG
jgi:hypothetical protein